MTNFTVDQNQRFSQQVVLFSVFLPRIIMIPSKLLLYFRF